MSSQAWNEREVSRVAEFCSCATRIVLDQGKPAVVVFADGGQETLKYVSDIPGILAGLRKLGTGFPPLPLTLGLIPPPHGLKSVCMAGSLRP